MPCPSNVQKAVLRKVECLPQYPMGDTPYNGLYEEVPPERGTFFRLQEYKRVYIVGISQAEVFKRAFNL